MTRSRYLDLVSNIARGLVPALALILLSGCAVGPDYQRPEATTIPDAYVGPGKDWKVANPQAHLPRGNWWEIFRDPELNQLEADAMAANQDLQVAVSRFAQARAVANVAESALFPRIGVSAVHVDQRDSKHRRAGGMVSDLDVAQAETVLKSTEAQVPDIAIQRARYQNSLAVLTGKPASLFQLPERPLDISPLVIPPGLPSELLERRPDIAAAERRMAAANANIGVATAAFFPTVKLSGIAGFQSGGLDMLFDWPSNFWAVGPSVTLPLFQGGQLNATLRQTKAVYEETVAKYRQTVLTAFADVENNLVAEHLLTDEYRKVLDALKSGRRQEEIAGNRYSAGLATYLEVANAQNIALGIERTGVRLRGQQLVSVTALVKSLGGGWLKTESCFSSNRNSNFLLR